MTANTDSPARAKKTADASLARHLSIRADKHAHETAAPLYDLGDELFCQKDVDIAHVWEFFASVEETHALLISDLEAVVDTDPRVFDAIAAGTDVATGMALVARELDEDDDLLRHRIDAARCVLDRAAALLDDLEDDLDLDLDA